MIGAEVIENLAGAGEKIIGGGIELGKNLASIGGGVAAAFTTKDSEGKAQDAKGMSSEGLGAVMRKAGSAIGGTVTMGAPGTYIETPKFYQYANTDQGLQVSFALSNTLTDKGAKMNGDFIKEFTMINRPTREAVSYTHLTLPTILRV